MSASADAIGEHIDLPALFAHAAVTFGGEREALVAYRTSDLEGPRSVWSLDELATDVGRTAAFFRALRLQADERIAILLPTVPEIHPLLWGGVAVAGVALINPLLRVDHISHLLDKVGASVLCVPSQSLSPELAATAERIATDRPALRLVSVGTDGEFPACLDRFNIDTSETYARSSHAFAALFHTGGTTGRPKIAPLSLANLVYAARLLTPVLQYSPEDRFFSPLPLFHIAGAIVGGLAPFLAGSTVVMPAPAGLRDPRIVQQCWRLLEREKATMMVAVPTSLAALSDVALGDADLSALRYVLTGTAPLPEETARRFSALTGKAVYTGYGMTESAGVIAYAPRSEPARASTVGKPLPGLDVRIAPLDTGRGPIGRILVRGPNVFGGYLGVAKIDTHDWFDTGDLGFIDEEDWLTLTGRSKDLIIRGGHNIDPAIIEECAVRHPDVILAAAVGQIDDYAGEVPALYVQLRPGTNERDAISRLAEIMEHEIAEPPARPRAVYAISPMPTTAVGKIYKPALRIDAAHRRISRLLVENGVFNHSVSVRDNEGGGLIVTVRLDSKEADRRQDLQGLLRRFPVQVQIDIANREAV